MNQGLAASDILRNNVKEKLARGEVARRAAGKTFRRLDLGLFQNREDLFATGLGYAHDTSPCLASPPCF